MWIILIKRYTNEKLVIEGFAEVNTRKQTRRK